MKKGFTLVELLATITLLSLLFLLVYPKVLDMVENKEKEIDAAKIELIHNAALDYMNADIDHYPQEIGATYCINLELLDSENLIPVDITDVMEEYFSIRVKIGANSNHSYTLLKEKCQTS